MNVSVLGFGGAEIGYEGASSRTVERLLNTALDAGLNLIDTAECYANSEELIGAAIADRRREVFIITKCGHADGISGNDWDPKMLEGSIVRSLKRLRTDCVDAIQLHSCSEELLRRGEVIEVLERARKAGQTRFIGYSGDGGAALHAVKTGRFDTLQISINIADQQAINLVLPEATKAGVGIIAKRPIANAVWKHSTAPSEWYVRPYWDRLRKLDYDFLKSPTEQSVSIALRYTLSVPGVSTAIVGTKNPERWHENARMLEMGKLPLAQINAIHDRWKSAAEKDWVGQQ